MLIVYGINFSIIYNLYRIIINGNYGYNYFINDLTDKYNFIKKDKDTPEFLKNNMTKITEFYKNNIIDQSVVIDKYKLLQITNDIYLNQSSVQLIDILNRYFNYLSIEFSINNFGIYIINEDKTFFQYQDSEKIKTN